MIFAKPAFAAMAAFAAATAAAAVNILHNGDFEEMDEDVGFPAGWTFSAGTSNGVGTFNDNNKHGSTGNISVYLNEAPSGSGKINSIEQRVYPVPGSYFCKARFFQRLNTATKGGFRYVALQDGKVLSGSSQTVPSNSEESSSWNWTNLQENTTCVFRLEQNPRTQTGSTGSIGIDNVEVCLSSLMVPAGQTLQYRRGAMNPKFDLRLFGGATLKFMVAEGFDDPPRYVCLAEGAKLAFDFTGWTGTTATFSVSTGFRVLGSNGSPSDSTFNPIERSDLINATGVEAALSEDGKSIVFKKRGRKGIMVVFK